MTRKRRKYSKEFKQEAVQLVEKIGLSKASKELGVHYDVVRRWVSVENKGGIANPPSKSMENLEAEIRRLRKENEYLKRISEVLKKSTAIFSSDHIGGSK